MVKVLYSDITDYRFNHCDIVAICENRKKYIESIKDEKRKIQSALAWRLLEFSIEKFFNEKIVAFSNENGEWKDASDKIKFSISHSNNVVAVCISNLSSVGVDVEMFSKKILKIKSLFFANDDFKNEIKYLTKKWTEKESIYKSKNKGHTFSEIIKDKLNNHYYLTVCADDFDVEFISVNLSNILSKKETV